MLPLNVNVRSLNIEILDKLSLFKNSLNIFMMTSSLGSSMKLHFCKVVQVCCFGGAKQGSSLAFPPKLLLKYRGFLTCSIRLPSKIILLPPFQVSIH